MSERRLPKKWNDHDQAVWRLRVQQQKSWRQIAVEMGRPNSWAAIRSRFYKRMAALEVAEVEAWRAEELDKYDEREQMAMATWAAAMRGHGPDGQLEPQLSAAVGALREMSNISKGRRQLLGLDTPVTQRVEVESPTAKAEIDDILGRYLDGYNDGRADARTARD